MSIQKNIKLDFTAEIDFSKILTNPILDIAARVWEDDQYQAFKSCYRSMRIIDDLIDERKSTGKKFSFLEKGKYKKEINNWIANLTAKTPVDDFQKELLEIIEQFKIPFTPWIRLSQAMIYDIYNNGYSSFISFLRYTEGAAIAPASIFMHLCGVKKEITSFSAPPYDIRQAARPLAIFSYLVHIIRDFQKDRLAGLNYFPDEFLREFQLDDQTLFKTANENEIPDNFRKLVTRYKTIANRYKQIARQQIDSLSPCLEPRYQLSLELIYNLYLQIYEKIDPENGLFTTEELNPTKTEVQNRIEFTVSSFQRKI